MQELYSDSDFKRTPRQVNEFVEAYSVYWAEQNPGERRRPDPEMFAAVEKYCRKHGIRPVFFIHAVFNYSMGEKVNPFLFKQPQIIERYKSWAERIPPELAAVDIESPHTIDVHRELETTAAMILTKHGILGFGSLQFKIACADPMLETSAVARIVLSEAHAVVLRYYGQEYIDWSTKSKWHAMVLADFGLDHEQISKEITNAGTRKPSTNN